MAYRGSAIANWMFPKQRSVLKNRTKVRPSPGYLAAELVEVPTGKTLTIEMNPLMHKMFKSQARRSGVTMATYVRKMLCEDLVLNARELGYLDKASIVT